MILTSGGGKCVAIYCVDTSQYSAVSYGIELAATCRIHILMDTALSLVEQVIVLVRRVA